LTLEPGPEAREQTAALPSSAVAQISLDDVPIASAVARFNSLNETRIVIDDPEIGEIKIIGLFSAHEPEQFAQAAAVVADARVVRRGRDIVLQPK
jgi:transmembrane sensor